MDGFCYVQKEMPPKPSCLLIKTLPVPRGEGLQVLASALALGLSRKRGTCTAEMQVSFWHFIQLAGCEGWQEQVRCLLKSSSGISEPVRVIRQWGGKREGGRRGENMAKVIEYILRSNL